MNSRRASARDNDDPRRRALYNAVKARDAETQLAANARPKRAAVAHEPHPRTCTNISCAATASTARTCQGPGRPCRQTLQSRAIDGRLDERLTVWRSGWDSARSLRKLAADMPLRSSVGRTEFERPYPPRQKCKRPQKGAFHILAERVGFEPTVRENRTPDFEAGPFDHSGTSPQVLSAAIFMPIPRAGRRIVRNDHCFSQTEKAQKRTQDAEIRGHLR